MQVPVVKGCRAEGAREADQRGTFGVANAEIAGPITFSIVARLGLISHRCPYFSVNPRITSSMLLPRSAILYILEVTGQDAAVIFIHRF